MIKFQIDTGVIRGRLIRAGYGAYYRKNIGIASILWFNKRYADWTGLRLSATTQ